jgi:pimeloyl-ACP methyl ester carboxylesterase
MNKGGNGMAAFHEEYMKVGSTTIHVLSGGTGEPLLFLHGASGGSKWMPFMQELSKTYRVIAPEHPGFGTSDDPEWLEDISDYVIFYADFIDQLGYDKVHLAGLSLGGWLAAEFAVLYRERLHSLTLVDAAGIYVPGVETGDMFIWNKETAARNLFYNQELAQQIINHEPSSEEMEILVKNKETTAKLVWNPRWFNPKLEGRLYRINVPSLIVWGDHDRLLPVEYAHAYQRLIPHAKLEVIEQCGHLPVVEKPQEFVHGVLTFLQDLK